MSSEAAALVEHLRRQIVEADATLVSLLRRRASLSEAIAIVKDAAGLPIHDPSRELALLDLLAPQQGPVRDAYREVVRVCREHSIRARR